MKSISGFYDDNGNKINPELVKKPGLCLVCKKNVVDHPMEDMMCMMNRFDQRDEQEFRCGPFVAKKKPGN